jgi:hypothetical protein
MTQIDDTLELVRTSVSMKPPSECPNCGSPIWVQDDSDRGLGINTVYECGDSLLVRNGEIFTQDGSASFPRGPACVLLRTRREVIRRARELAVAVEAMCAGECPPKRVETLALSFLRERAP